MASPEQRKTVTIVFCDLTGSTAMGEQLDPESLRHVLRRYYARMQAILTAHGGSVEKFIGDAVMAVFGVPALHEDDALRAARAACEMRDSVVELNRELEDEWGAAIQVRIGVNTGEVVTTADRQGSEGFVDRVEGVVRGLRGRHSGGRGHEYKSLSDGVPSGVRASLRNRNLRSRK